MFLGRIYRFFAEIDDPLDDRYVGLLTDGSSGHMAIWALSLEKKPTGQHDRL